MSDLWLFILQYDTQDRISNGPYHDAHDTWYGRLKSERAFSAASHVMIDLLTTLDPDHLDELLLIRSHSKQWMTVTSFRTQ